MRWTPGGRSVNVEDRRGQGGYGGFGGFGVGRGVPMGIGGVLLLLVLSIFFGRDFVSNVAVGPQDTTEYRQPSSPSQSAAEEPMVQFVSFVLDDAQNTWRRLFAASGRRYQDAKLVLFRDVVRSGCGFAQSATGPFYCPEDQKIYIDLSFYDELKRRFGAPGDFAQAYVLAHEIGHHVQNQLGIGRQVNSAQQSVRVELQADCLAGVWGHSTAQRDILERGDADEALNAAAAIGDDRLQRQTTGRVSPDSFTHGTSAQRVAWFRRGMETGQVAACDTFNAGAR